jgi:ferric-dicitrate binding protein FerR (iron transport regulator)
VLRPAIHGGVDGSNTYTSRTELHEAMAEAFEQAGNRDSAVAHYRAVEQAWRHADPEFAERYRRARAAAERVGPPPGESAEPELAMRSRNRAGRSGKAPAGAAGQRSALRRSTTFDSFPSRLSHATTTRRRNEYGRDSFPG